MSSTSVISKKKPVFLCDPTRCRRKRGGLCSFAHSKEELYIPKIQVCRYGFKCPSQDTCIRIHNQPPQKCKYGYICNRRDTTCYMDHSAPPEKCRFGYNCNNQHCNLDHSSQPQECEWGFDCSRKEQGCNLLHSFTNKGKPFDSPCSFGLECIFKDTCRYSHPEELDAMEIESEVDVESTPEVSTKKERQARLEVLFNQSPYLDRKKRDQIAMQLNMTTLQLSTWFNNKRFRWRKKNIKKLNSSVSSLSTN